MEHYEGDTFLRKRSGILKIRYLISFLMFVSSFLVYAMRVNLSVSILAMNNSTMSDAHGGYRPGTNGTILPSNGSDNADTCRPVNTELLESDTELASESHMQNLRKREGEFNWNEQEQAVILNAFFAGYLITQIPGGYLAETMSVRWVLGVGVGLTSLLTCLTSVVAHYSYYAFIALRVAEGLTEGVTFPAIFAILARWTPRVEQSLLVNAVTSGAIIGTVVALPVSAMLCDSALGWPASFYVFGGLGILWTAVWFCIATDCPEDHPWISTDEHEYIVETRSTTFNEKRPSVPWLKLLTSPAVLLLGLLKFAASLNYYMIIIELPSYLNAMFATSIVNNGWVNSVMNLAIGVTLVATGFIADKLLERKVVGRTALRKSFAAASTLVPAACMCLLRVFGCSYDPILATVLVNCVFLGFSGGGDAAMALDIAPRFAGPVSGLANMLGNVAGLAAPQLVGMLTYEENTLTQWNRVFLYNAICTAVGAGIFLVFGSADQQSWASEVGASELSDDGGSARDHSSAERPEGRRDNASASGHDSSYIKLTE